MVNRKGIILTDLIALSLVLVFIVGLIFIIFTTQTSVNKLSEEKTEIHIKAHRWIFQPNNITVIKGKPVTLVVSSMDVVHGFKIEKLGINEIIIPGEEIKITITFQKTGIYTFKCSIYCGEPYIGSGKGHWTMQGTIVVIEEK